MNRPRPYYERKGVKEIISLISNGTNFNLELSKKLKAMPNFIIYKLQRLENEGIINSIRERRYNRKRYFLSEKGMKLLTYFGEMEHLEKREQKIDKKRKKLLEELRKNG